MRFLFLLALLTAPALAETSAEAFTAFRKALQEAATDKTVTTPAREAMRTFAGRLGGSETMRLSPEILRGWMAEMGAGWPPAVQKTAASLAAVLDRESTARVGELESLTREIFEGIVQAKDETALEPLAEKLRTKLQDRGASVFLSERGQAVFQALASTQQSIEGWRSAFAAQTAGKPAEALRQLGNLGSAGRDMPPDIARKLREKSRELAVTMGIRPPAEVDQEIRKLIAEVLAAPSAKSLDPLVQVFRAKQELWNSAGDLGSRESAELIRRAAKFTGSWQEYLAAKAAGSTDRARTVLNTLINSETDMPGVPRSMLLDLSLQESLNKTASAADTSFPGMPRTARFDQMLAACKTLSNLEEKIGELESASRQYPGNPFSPNPRIVEELRAINRDYQDAKVSTRPQVVPEQGAASESSAVRELRRQLTLHMLARQFDSPAAEDDKPAAYLRRRLMAAREAKDWRAMQRILDAANIIGVRGQLCLASDGASLTHFLAGVNFEDAAVARFAVASYLSALKTGSDFVPIEEVRTRLEKLRSGHAEDYEEGLKVAASGGLPTTPVEQDWREENKKASTPAVSPAIRGPGGQPGR